MRLLFLLLLLISLFVGGNCGICICDYSTTSRRLSHSNRKPPNVAFYPALLRGDVYERKSEPAERYIDPLQDEDVDCPSQQIHISLGDTLDSVVVSYASFEFSTPSSVQFSTDLEALMAEDDDGSYSKLVTTAVGTKRAYSELLYTVYFSMNPAMGQPTVNKSEWVDMLDTSDWAFDHQTGQRYANWYSVNESTMETGFGQYNNPDVYYNSPIIHKVPLYGLTTDTTYFYRVAGSCEIFNFTTLPFYFAATHHVPAMYPFKLGLTGDVGMTSVSIKSLAALVALQTDTVLLVGDLCYADGWQYIYDSFGNAAQDLAAHTPLLTTVGNVSI